MRTTARKPVVAGTLYGKSVLLRRMRAQDAEELDQLRVASRAFHAPWIDEDRPLELTSRGPRSRGSDAIGAAGRAPSKRKSSRRTWVLCRREDGRIVGSIALSGHIGGVMQSAFVSYWIGAPFARQGFMRAGLELLLGHAFESGRVHRLEALILQTNEASRRLASRVGFRLEGVARRLIWTHGKWRDHERWALTREDWRAR